MIEKKRLLHIRLAVPCPKSEMVVFCDECDRCDDFRGPAKVKGDPKIQCAYKNNERVD